MTEKNKPILEMLSDVSDMAIEKAGSGLEPIQTNKTKSTDSQGSQDNQQSKLNNKLTSDNSDSKTSNIKDSAKSKLELLNPNKKEPRSYATNSLVKLLVIAGVAVSVIGLFLLFVVIALGVFVILLGITVIFIGVFAPIRSSKKQQQTG